MDSTDGGAGDYIGKRKHPSSPPKVTQLLETRISWKKSLKLARDLPRGQEGIACRKNPPAKNRWRNVVQLELV